MPTPSNLNPAELNAQLVAQLKQNQLIKRSEIAQAFLATPRHFFVPNVGLAEAYADRAIMTKTQGGVALSSCSQPAMIAIMLEQLDLRAGMNVLEIGAGTGYNAALMRRIVGGSGHVTTMDIDEDIAQQARANLQAAGITDIAVRCGDGGLGHADGAPYDRIILTVGAWDISPAWLAQLGRGGLLVLPLLLGAQQYSITFEKVNHHLRSRDMQCAGFIPLRGSFARLPVWVNIGAYGISGEAVEQIEPGKLRALLEQPRIERALPDALKALALNDLCVYMTLQGDTVLRVVTQQSEEQFTSASALYAPHGDSLVMLMTPAPASDDSAPRVRLHGSQAAWELLEQRAASFIAAGRPSLATGALTVYPLGDEPAPTAGQLILRKRWMAYALTLTQTV